jgi:exodeoxyribonuclease VII large subunit
MALHARGERALAQTRTQLHQLHHRLASLHPRAQILAHRTQLAELERRLTAIQPGARLVRARHDHAALVTRATTAMRARLESGRADLARLGAQMAALSPLAVLDRGYAMVSSNSTIVREAAQVEPGARLRVRLARGALEVIVDCVEGT